MKLACGGAPGNSWRLRRHGSITECAFALLIVFAAATGVRAQDKNPFADDANDAKLGEFQFRSNCAFCHGLRAPEGGRGPELTRARKKDGNADADLVLTNNEG